MCCVCVASRLNHCKQGGGGKSTFRPIKLRKVDVPPIKLRTLFFFPFFFRKGGGGAKPQKRTRVMAGATACGPGMTANDFYPFIRFVSDKVMGCPEGAYTRFIITVECRDGTSIEKRNFTSASFAVNTLQANDYPPCRIATMKFGGDGLHLEWCLEQSDCQSAAADSHGTASSQATGVVREAANSQGTIQTQFWFLIKERVTPLRGVLSEEAEWPQKTNSHDDAEVEGGKVFLVNIDGDQVEIKKVTVDIVYIGGDHMQFGLKHSAPEESGSSAAESASSESSPLQRVRDVATPINSNAKDFYSFISSVSKRLQGCPKGARTSFRVEVERQDGTTSLTYFDSALFAVNTMYTKADRVERVVSMRFGDGGLRLEWSLGRSDYASDGRAHFLTVLGGDRDAPSLQGQVQTLRKVLDGKPSWPQDKGADGEVEDSKGFTVKTHDDEETIKVIKVDVDYFSGGALEEGADDDVEPTAAELEELLEEGLLEEEVAESESSGSSALQHPVERVYDNTKDFYSFIDFLSEKLRGCPEGCRTKFRVEVVHHDGTTSQLALHSAMFAVNTTYTEANPGVRIVIMRSPSGSLHLEWLLEQSDYATPATDHRAQLLTMLGDDWHAPSWKAQAQTLRDEVLGMKTGWPQIKHTDEAEDSEGFTFVAKNTKETFKSVVVDVEYVTGDPAQLKRSRAILAGAEETSWSESSWSSPLQHASIATTRGTDGSHHGMAANNFYPFIRFVSEKVMGCPEGAHTEFRIEVEGQDGPVIVLADYSTAFFTVKTRDAKGNQPCRTASMHFGSDDLCLEWRLEQSDCQSAAASHDAASSQAIDGDQGATQTQRDFMIKEQVKTLREFLSDETEWPQNKGADGFLVSTGGGNRATVKTVTVYITYIGGDDTLQRGSKRNTPEEIGRLAATAAATSSSNSKSSPKKAKHEVANAKEVRFFREMDPFSGYLSNFHVHKTPLIFAGKKYATAEALYQALKFMQDPDNEANLKLAEAIRTQSTPYKAKILAGSGKGNYKWQQVLAAQHNAFVRDGAKFPDDWDERRLDIMRSVVQLKFEQDEALVTRLVWLGDRPLVEASPYDSFWGAGRDGRGQNWLGKILEETRARFFGARDGE